MEGCTHCEAEDYCITCDAANYDEVSRICYRRCPSNQFRKDISQCVNNRENCQTAVSNSGECIQCNTPFVVNQYNNCIPSPCADNFAHTADTGLCEPCPAKCTNGCVDYSFDCIDQIDFQYSQIKGNGATGVWVEGYPTVNGNAISGTKIVSSYGDNLWIQDVINREIAPIQT
jgi:hypothetical protein